jgi:hypothetical protein
MVISERHVKIQISNIVVDCRHYIFHPKEHEDLPKKFNDAEAELKGIGRLFPEGKIARYVKTYREELAHLPMLAGVDSACSEKDGKL